MFLLQKSQNIISSHSILTSSFYNGNVAYSSKEEGLVVKNAESGKIIFQNPKNHYSHLQLTKDFFVYQKKRTNPVSFLQTKKKIYIFEFFSPVCTHSVVVL